MNTSRASSGRFGFWVSGVALFGACGGQPRAAPVSAANGAAAPPSSAAPPPQPATPTVAAAPPPAPSAPAEAPAAPSKPQCPAGMALVDGGEFKPSNAKKPVSIGALCVDVTETTAQAYAECVQGNACKADNTSCGSESTYGKAEKAQQPMVCVDFAQANAYCAFRGKRLPKTEEWEWVARSGTEARPYPWGDGAPAAQLCWTGKEKRRESCPVGSFSTGDSAQGIKDLAGNVLEFTTTEQDAKSSVRIARGGSWRDGAPELVRNARIGGFGLTYRCTFLGIRCVSEAPR